MNPLFNRSLLCSVALAATSMSAQTNVSTNTLSNNPTYDVTHALQDRVAGVDLLNMGSAAGDALSIAIRGYRTINEDSQPWIIIDGLPSVLTLTDIDPEEIASIQILKDAATSALYGSRGRNGVLLITTKHGSVEGKRQLTYSGYVGSRTSMGRVPMMNARELRNLRESLEMGPYNVLLESEEYDIDWYDRYTKTGLVQNHNLSYTGGWNGGGLHAGVGYVEDRGILAKERYRRLYGSLDARQHVGQHIQLGASVRYTSSDKRINNANMAEYIVQSPMLRPEHRTADSVIAQVQYDAASVDGRYNLSLSCPWVEGLSYRFDGALGWADYQFPFGSHPGRTVTGKRGVEQFNHTMQHQLSYVCTLGDNHHLSAMTQYTRQRQELEESSFHVKRDPDSSNNDSYIYPVENEWTVNGLKYKALYRQWATSLHYDYANRYELTYDWAKEWHTMCDLEKNDYMSLFQFENLNSHPSMSVLAKWNLHNEPWFGLVDWIDALTLRYGWGKIGFPNTVMYIAGRPIFSHAYLKDESVGSSDWGMDFSLWEGRLNGTVDLYRQNVHGHEVNHGWEMALQGTVIDHCNDWTWSVGVDLYGNWMNWLNAYGGTVPAGYEMPFFDGYKFESEYSLPVWYQIDKKNYYLDLYDVFTDPEYGEVNRKNLERYEPDLKGGFNTRVAWRNIDLEVVAGFQLGGEEYMTWDKNNQGNLRYHHNVLDDDMVTDPNMTAEEKYRYYVYGTSDPERSWIDATKCMVRSITLGWDAPAKWLDRWSIGQLRLYATVQNPWVFGSDFYDKYGYCPETNSKSNESLYNKTCFEHIQFVYPTIDMKQSATRNYILGLKVAF